jgi:glycosyltransferase involved in cell wall biosynthesis
VSAADRRPGERASVAGTSSGRTARPLRVGLNLLFMGEHAGGAGRYAAELPGALLAAEPATEIHLFVSRSAPAELRRAPWAGEVRWVTLPLGSGGSPLQTLAQFTGLPPLALARGLDVLHSPANTGPVITPRLASVVSLLDLIWLHRSDEWEADARAHAAMRRQVSHCVRHADRVFAISQAAAEDFVRTLRVPRERIDVTPLGVHPGAGSEGDVGSGDVGSEDVARRAIEHAGDGRNERDGGRPAAGEGAQALRARLELGSQRIVLCVAQKRPYKNLHSLIRALPDLEEDVVLVLVGSPTEHEQELRALAADLGVAERVRFPGWLADAELERLYALSELFVLPSLIEGFGIPVLEAMAHGVPVACSNVSALPEVAGDAALLFDPERQEEVTGAVRRLLDDRALAERLVARGHARAASFNWKRTGVASLAGYRRAIDTHRRLGILGGAGSRTAGKE